MVAEKTQKMRQTLNGTSHSNSGIFHLVVINSYRYLKTHLQLYKNVFLVAHLRSNVFF